MCVGMSMSGAKAVDISLKSTLYQSFEGNSNYLMQTNPTGVTYTPVSTITVDAVARTPTMRFATTVDLSYQSYFGQGAETLLPAFNRGFRGSAEKFDNMTTYKLEGSIRTTQAFHLQLAETGVATVGGETTTSWVEYGVRRQLSYWDLVAWTARATSIQFTAPNTVPSLDVTTTGTWTHRVNQLTELTPMVQFETIGYGNPTNSSNSTNSISSGNTQFMIWRGTLGVHSQLTKRLTFDGAIGVADITLNQSGGGTLPSGTTVLNSSGSAADWIGNMLVSYRITSRDTVSLAAAQTIGPDSLGVLRKFDNVGLVLSHRFDRHSGLTVTTDYSHQPLIAGGFTDLYSAGATYDFQFLQDWSTAVSYRFRQRIGVPGDANSHAVFMSVNRDVTIIPSATGQPQTPTPADITTLLSWPAAWIRPWRNASWWQR